MAKSTNGVYRLTAHWDDQDAEYLYELERDTGSSFKKPELIADGDLDWAKRTAKHYDIKLPDVPDDFKAETTPTSAPITTVPTPPNSIKLPNPVPGTSTPWTPPFTNNSTGGNNNG